VPVTRIECADPPVAAGTAMAYDVTVERTRECPTAVVRANTTWREFPALWRTLLDEVWAFLSATPGLRTDGHNVMLYRRGVPGVEVAVEVGVQVTRTFESAGRVLNSTLPVAEAAKTIHSGPPAQIGAAHDAVRAWCTAHRREMTGVSWEIYGDPDTHTGHFDVAVYWQFA
jgi:effector-binding domain-containing protein